MQVDLEIPENIKYVVEILAKEESIDEKTALRRLIYEGMKGYILNLYSKGKLSLSKSAELLNLSVYDVLRLAKAYGLEIGSTLEHGKISRKLTEEIIKA